jgi:hypothetical protein
LRLAVEGEAVDQEHRLAVLPALDDVANPDTGGVETGLFDLRRFGPQAGGDEAETNH